MPSYHQAYRGGVRRGSRSLERNEKKQAPTESVVRGSNVAVIVLAGTLRDIEGAQSNVNFMDLCF